MWSHIDPQVTFMFNKRAYVNDPILAIYEVYQKFERPLNVRLNN